MAATPSQMLDLGSPAPHFTLPDAVSGREVSMASFAGRPALLVMFICNHCPYVKHIRAELARLGRDYGGRIGVVGINSNDTLAYPDDAPDKMAAEAHEAGYTFPYLFDETQNVAKAYRAACTPDFFLFDGSRRLVYRGQLDDSRPAGRSGSGTGGGIPVTGKDLRDAIEAVLSGRPVSPLQKPSIGCNIKWKPGGEPSYYRA
ncbi:MAG: thioredoxin family protein [Phycisphaerales bacterium]|nr:thioredoxin family protein [Phycisphaerales bacterium]